MGCASLRLVSCLALAVATFHQFAAFLLTVAGVIEGSVYSMRPVPPFAVPVIFDLMFWGGVWSVIYAAVAAGLSSMATGFAGLHIRFRRAGSRRVVRRRAAQRAGDYGGRRRQAR
jgi:hypothetical protein